jgi:LmbE family N-acetylglucosaminyl deacetylase
MLADEDVRRTLVVAAHPDDIDYACAGTVATWTAKGIKVTYCVVTDGDAGGFDPDVPRIDIAPLRQAEQREAAARVGVSEVVFLGYPDGRLQPTYDLRRDLSRVIRQVRPERMVIPSPHRALRNTYGSHPDHQATGEASLCAVYPDARNRFAHSELLAGEGLEPYAVPEVWVVSNDEHADVYVDITDMWEQRISALLAHSSQLAEIDDPEGMLREWFSGRAADAGLPPRRLAEAFLVLDTR